MKALLIIDMLNDFMSEKGSLFCGHSCKKIIPFIRRKIEEFRKNKDLVIYLTDNHDENDIEFKLFPKHCVSGTKGAKVIEELKPKKQDIIIPKKTFDGMFESGLEFVLKKNNINEVYLTGVCTSICVMETAGSLVKRRYQLSLFKDGLADFDPQAHKFALKRIKMIYGANII